MITMSRIWKVLKMLKNVKSGNLFSFQKWMLEIEPAAPDLLLFIYYYLLFILFYLCRGAVAIQWQSVYIFGVDQCRAVTQSHGLKAGSENFLSHICRKMSKTTFQLRRDLPFQGILMFCLGYVPEYFLACVLFPPWVAVAMSVWP